MCFLGYLEGFSEAKRLLTPGGEKIYAAKLFDEKIKLDLLDVLRILSQKAELIPESFSWFSLQLSKMEENLKQPSRSLGPFNEFSGVFEKLLCILESIMQGI